MSSGNQRSQGCAPWNAEGKSLETRQYDNGSARSSLGDNSNRANDERSAGANDLLEPIGHSERNQSDERSDERSLGDNSNRRCKLDLLAASRQSFISSIVGGCQLQ